MPEKQPFFDSTNTNTCITIISSVGWVKRHTHQAMMWDDFSNHPWAKPGAAQFEKLRYGHIPVGISKIRMLSS